MDNSRTKKRQLWWKTNKKSKLSKPDATAEKKPKSKGKPRPGSSSPSKSTSIEDTSSVENVTKVKQKKVQKAAKYVLFVGNLPFTVSKEDIEAHFAITGGVTAVRLLTDKDTGKARGFAYVEFQDDNSLRLGLGLHKSSLKGRKINVEFTSIGGGKSQKRKDKLKQKNSKMERFKQMPWK